MKTVLTIVFSLASLSVFASGTCENMAKSAAIRTYVSNTEGVDKANLTYSAVLVSSSRGLEKYSVSVGSPCSVDGDDGNCNADYDVVTMSTGSKCSVKSIKEN